MTPKTVASSTSTVPRSGWSRISAAGSEATASMPRTSRWRTSRWRQEPSVRSATTSAMPITTDSLANSAGWIDMPAITIHDREPLMVEPMASTSSRPIRETTYTGGARMRTHRCSVAATRTASTMPMAMLTRWRRRKACESPPVSTSRSAVADHTSIVPSTSSAAVATSSSQSSRGTRARLDSVRIVRGRASGARLREDEDGRPGARSAIRSPCSVGVGVVDGGRIEPSSAKTGSRSGGATPGIAASAGTTFMPLTP